MKPHSDPSGTWELGTLALFLQGKYWSSWGKLSSAGPKTILSLTELHMTTDWTVLTTALGRCVSCSLPLPLRYSAFICIFYTALLLGKKQGITFLAYHPCSLVPLPTLSSSFWSKKNPPLSWVFFGEGPSTSPFLNRNIQSLCSLTWVTLSKTAASPWHRVSLGPGL